MSKRFVALFPVLALGVALPFVTSSETSATISQDLSAPKLGLELTGEADSIHGSYFSEAGGFVEFDAAVISDHVVQVELHTSTVSASFRADYEIGELLIDGNDELLTPKDWKAINSAYAAISELEEREVNPIATLYTHRALGMMAESMPGFVWNSWDSKLPVLDEADPSFFDRDATVSPEQGELQVLRRRGSTGSTGVGPSPDPSVLAAYPALPKISDCDGFLSDSRSGRISCVEYGNYYCVGFDLKSTWGDKPISTIAPVIPPTWSRPMASKLATPSPNKTTGAYPCSGRCGPGCEDAPDWIGGGGGFTVGCLIHDHCVYEATGGKDLSSAWATTKHYQNLQASPNCGREMRSAADDHFSPPEFCPGSSTVGGAGKWHRYAPPRITKKHKKLYNNTVSKTVTPSVGSFPITFSPSKPNSGPNPKNKKCKVNPDAAGCDMK